MADLAQRLTAALADRYRIERELGRGGMANVHLAEEPEHHRRVAIKLLDPGAAAATGRQRFLRGIETVARWTHPHILRWTAPGARSRRVLGRTPVIRRADRGGPNGFVQPT